MSKPSLKVFNTPGRECAHADKGQCVACQLRPSRYVPMENNAVIGADIAPYVKNKLAGMYGTAQLRLSRRSLADCF